MKTPQNIQRYNAETILDYSRADILRIVRAIITERDAARHEAERLAHAVEALREEVRVLRAANRTFGREADRYE